VIIGLPVLTVILVLALFGGIALHIAGSGGTRSERASSGPVVPPAIGATTFASVGTGNILNPIQRVSPGVQVLRDSSGKPVFLWLGAEYCPYCAAERWSVVVALDRFGSFTNLHASSSSDLDVYPDTPTFTFHGSQYSSQYLTFESVELEDRNQKPLETPTPTQSAQMQRYDPDGSIPFLDIGNQYLQIGSAYSVAVLVNQSWNSIANQLNNPSSLITQNIVANANYIAAAICRLTNNQPASVCSVAPNPKIEGIIGKPGGQ
jgi:hypothetical protein